MSTKIETTMAVIRKHAPNFNPKIAIILGSGLSDFADQLTSPITIPYQAIPGLTSSHVIGHASLLVLGYFQGIPIACLKGRLHRYEGASWDAMKTLIYLIKHLGCHSLIITGAAGSLDPNTLPGELMMIKDHINLQPGNPLAGPNDESIGPRFPSLENAYDQDFREILQKSADNLEIKLTQGVYISLLGPSFETPAEIRCYRSWGADAVGMSVVPEVIIARHCGLKIAAIAAISNLAVGLSSTKVTHEVTIEYANTASRKLIKLITSAINKIVEIQ